MATESFAGLTLARIVRPWGRRGEVAAEVLTDFPARLTALRKVWLNDGRNPPRMIGVLSCRIHLGQAIFHFEGEDSTTRVERLRGVEVQVPLSDRMTLAPGRYYIADLVGCGVWEQGAAIGTVREVLNSVDRKSVEPAASGAPQAWLLVVETPGGEMLIPMAAEICTSIDTAARRIEVRLPEGLRELNQ